MIHRFLTPTRVVILIVLLGLGLRGFHYFRDRAVWHDEAVVLVNVLDRGFAELLGPLRFHDAAPPLFLWAVKLTHLTLGDSALALRLVPFLASCLALILFVPVCRHFLAERTVPWALLLFACSEQLAWHACESKPYATDVLVSVVVLLLWTRLRHDRLVTGLLSFAAVAPLCIFSSYPACFVLGGVLLALVPAVWEQRSPRVVAGYCLFGAATVLSFLVLLVGPVKAQHDPIIHGDWLRCMPDYTRPWLIPVWTVASTFEVARYCIKPLGQALFPVALLGGWVLWRANRQTAVILLATPVGLALVAAFLHRYPYGGVRVLVYAAPAVCLLVAAGVPVLLDRALALHRGAWVAALALLLLPAATAGQRLFDLWPEADAPGAAGYVASCFVNEDRVVGNNWTHVYYFRTLGPRFTLIGESEPDALADRVWVVWADHTAPHAARLACAATRVPADWSLSEAREFHFTSVALYTRPGTDRSSVRADRAP